MKFKSMPFVVSDFIADTKHLTTWEIGAYFLLLGYQWVHRGRPIPKDERSLRLIANMQGQRFSKLERVLAMFTLTDEGYSHPRILRDLERLKSRYGTPQAVRRAARAASPRDANLRPARTDRHEQIQGVTEIDAQKHGKESESESKNPLEGSRTPVSARGPILEGESYLLAQRLGVLNWDGRLNWPMLRGMRLPTEYLVKLGLSPADSLASSLAPKHRTASASQEPAGDVLH